MAAASRLWFAAARLRLAAATVSTAVCKLVLPSVQAREQAAAARSAASRLWFAAAGLWGTASRLWFTNRRCFAAGRLWCTTAGFGAAAAVTAMAAVAATEAEQLECLSIRGAGQQQEACSQDKNLTLHGSNSSTRHKWGRSAAWVARPAENSWRLPLLNPLGTGEQPRRLFQIAFPGSYRRMIFRVFTSLRLRHKLLRICEPSSAKYAPVPGVHCKPVAPTNIVRCGCKVAQTKFRGR